MAKVAINGLGRIGRAAFKYCLKIMIFTNDSFTVDGKIIKVHNEKDPENLTWKELEIDIAFECNSFFIKKEDIINLVFICESFNNRRTIYLNQMQKRLALTTK